MTLKQRILAAMEEDPTLTSKAMAAKLGSPLGSVTKCCHQFGIKLARAYAPGSNKGPPAFRKIPYAGHEGARG